MMGRTDAGKAASSTEALSRKRWPMAGASALPVEPAWWRAGQT
jgi:hypothetical protein